MTKQTKTIIGVAAVGIVGYLVWKQMSKPKTIFANLADYPRCPCMRVVKSDKNYDYCSDGKTACRRTTTVLTTEPTY